MNNEKYQQIIDEVWKCFSNVRKSMLMLKPPASENKLREYIEWYEQITTKEEFINKCKTDSKFSEKWGLKIEERELTTVQERKKYDNYFDDLIGEYLEHHETLDKRGVPRKITTITYNGETIEVYE